jgi:hypothetical protein
MSPSIAQKRSWLSWRAMLTLIFLSIAAVLLFVRLGHYALWDDEACTALFAESIWQTGDESAVLGDNIIAYRNGAELSNLKARNVPPVSFYLVAPFTAMAAGGSGLVRLPFAICGLLCVALIVRWLWRDGAGWRMWLQVTIALLGNVSFFLYCRQCRYYGLCILLSAAIAYLYLHWEGSRRTLVGLGCLSATLLATQYIIFVALHLTLGADYFIFGRRRRPLRWGDWIVLLLPSIVTACLVVPIWNPLAHSALNGPPKSTYDRLWSVWLYCRDMDRAEFGALAVWLSAPLIYLLIRDRWLLRIFVALTVYIVLTGLLSPQSQVVYADIRYACPGILLSIATTAIVFASFKGKWTLVGIVLGLTAAGTNLLNGGPFLQGGLRSTIALFARELYDPPADPYRATADWINHNCPVATIWTIPDYATYPLMYHAPAAVYAWQLRDPVGSQFAGLPAINFMGRRMPQFIIVMGASALSDLLHQVHFPPGVNYGLVAVIPVNGQQQNRPELFMRSFKTLPCDPKSGQGIYCFKLEPPKPREQIQP